MADGSEDFAGGFLRSSASASYASGVTFFPAPASPIVFRGAEALRFLVAWAPFLGACHPCVPAHKIQRKAEPINYREGRIVGKRARPAFSLADR